MFIEIIPRLFVTLARNYGYSRKNNRLLAVPIILRGLFGVLVRYLVNEFAPYLLTDDPAIQPGTEAAPPYRRSHYWLWLDG
jgi:hypothetical protein